MQKNMRDALALTALIGLAIFILWLVEAIAPKIFGGLLSP